MLKSIFAKFSFLGSASVTLMLAACAAHVTTGTGFIKGKPVEFSMTEAGGAILDGYTLSMNGENLGVLLFDGKPHKDGSKYVSDFQPLATKYGIFDATRSMNINLASSTMTFTITLDGQYVGTVSTGL